VNPRPVAAALLISAGALAHQYSGPQGSVVVEWRAEHVSRVMSSGYGDSLGMEADVLLGFPERVSVDGHDCVEASYLLFDVDNDFAFDIFETVTLHLLLADNGADRISVAYDRNADAETLFDVELEPAVDGMVRQTVVLPDARFADRGEAGSDLMIGGGSVFYPGTADNNHRIVLCGLEIERSFGTPAHGPQGTLLLSLTDGLPARVGIYDATGRMPLPSTDARPIPFYADTKRQIFLRDSHGRATPWPHRNRHVFYVDGSYRASLAAGDYDLVISRGPEYRMTTRQFTINAGEQTSVRAAPERYIDMPARGWYSGDDHVHIARARRDNAGIAGLMQAEDIHVTNLLQMGNPASPYFLQYAFGEDGRYFLQVRERRHYGLVPGVEDPRTAVRGHTISLNVQEVVRRPDNYLLYDQTFHEYERQGALSGYAHVAGEWFNAARGLALDVPLGVVDFLEVLQDGTLGTGLWYDFLNLGFRLVPTAGSDFPYLNQPGAERNYVYLGQDFTADNWFDQLAAGRTFVTNGPILTLDVNGETMGATLDAAPGDVMQVRASARLNPDLEALASLELVANGEVIERVDAPSGAEVLTLDRVIEVERGFWLAVRAHGVSEMSAHSAAVYVVTDARGFRADNRVPDIVARMKARLAEFETVAADPRQELETWEVAIPLDRMLQAQRQTILERVDEAASVYDAILRDVRSWH